MTATIRQFDRLRSIKNSLKIAAAGSLAVGVATMTPAGNAGAVTFSSGQQLGFGGFTTDFNTAANTGANFSINFSGYGSAETAGVPSGTQLAALFTPGSNVNLTTPATGNFDYVSGGGLGTNLVYQLRNDLTFSFANNVSYTIQGGSRFSSTYNNTNQGLQFAVATTPGSFFEDRTSGDRTPALTSTFTFSDVPQVISGNYAGRYDVIASTTAVPEPFTVIGTIVGGTAAFRMRKKLANINKN
jgi:hypothetical protein